MYESNDVFINNPKENPNAGNQTNNNHARLKRRDINRCCCRNKARQHCLAVDERFALNRASPYQKQMHTASTTPTSGAHHGASRSNNQEPSKVRKEERKYQ